MLHSQASRAIKKVVCCSPGLPFKGWSLEPSDATQMSGEGALFPGRGTLVISWQIPKGGGQRLLWVRRKGEEVGGRGTLIVQRTRTHTQAHLLTGRHALARTHLHPHLEHSPADVSGGNMCRARTLACTCDSFMHVPPTTAHTHGLTRAFVPSLHFLGTFIDINPHSHIVRHSHGHKYMYLCTWIKAWMHSGSHTCAHTDIPSSFHPKSQSKMALKTFKICIL